MQATYSDIPFVCFVVFRGSISSPLAAERPNFVFIIADDVSHDDLGCFGNPTIKTPNLDRLAAEGLAFDRAYLTCQQLQPDAVQHHHGPLSAQHGLAGAAHAAAGGAVHVPAGAARGRLLHRAGREEPHGPTRSSAAFDEITNPAGPGGERDWVQASRRAAQGQAVLHVVRRGRRPPRLADRPIATRSTIPPRWSCRRTRSTARSRDKTLPTTATRSAGSTRFVGKVLRRAGTARRRREHLRHLHRGQRPAVPALQDAAVRQRHEDAVHRLAARHDQTGARPTRWSARSTSRPRCWNSRACRLTSACKASASRPFWPTPHATTRDYAFAEHNWHVAAAHERSVRHGDWLYIRNNLPEDAEHVPPNPGRRFPAGKELWDAHDAGKLNADAATTCSSSRGRRRSCTTRRTIRTNCTISPPTPRTPRRSPSYSEVLDRWTEETGDSVPANPTPSVSLTGRGQHLQADIQARPHARRRPRRRQDHRRRTGAEHE